MSEFLCSQDRTGALDRHDTAVPVACDDYSKIPGDEMT